LSPRAHLCKSAILERHRIEKEERAVRPSDDAHSATERDAGDVSSDDPEVVFQLLDRVVFRDNPWAGRLCRCARERYRRRQIMAPLSVEPAAAWAKGSRRRPSLLPYRRCGASRPFTLAVRSTAGS